MAVTAHEVQQECLVVGVADPHITVLNLPHSSHIVVVMHLLYHTLMSTQPWLKLSIVK